MSEDGEMWRDWREGNRRLRAELGVECPECRRLQPRRHATVLMPGWRCRVDGYRDPRPPVSDEERERITGWRKAR